MGARVCDGSFRKPFPWEPWVPAWTTAFHAGLRAESGEGMAATAAAEAPGRTLTSLGFCLVEPMCEGVLCPSAA